MLHIDGNECEIKGNSLDIMTDLAIIVSKTKKALINGAPELVKEYVEKSVDRVVVRALLDDFKTKAADFDTVGFMNRIIDEMEQES